VILSESDKPETVTLSITRRGEIIRAILTKEQFEAIAELKWSLSYAKPEFEDDVQRVVEEEINYAA